MKFEVIRKYDNRTMMCTEDEQCISFETLESQESSGYYFKLDGKRISAKELKSRLNYRPSAVQTRTTGNEVTSEVSEIAQPTITRKVRSIRCINNNKIYKNMSEAGKDLGLDSALISYSLKVNRPTKGYSFEFIE